MVYGVCNGGVEGIGDNEGVVFVVVSKADGSSDCLIVLVVLGGLAVFVVGCVEVVGDGMAAARVMLSRRSWRTALRCLRWSLSRRDTLDAVRDWVCTTIGGDADREGRRMARRRTVGDGPKVEETVAIVLSLGGRMGGQRLRAAIWELTVPETCQVPCICVLQRRSSR
jgi:hypothetical protein